MTTEWTKVEDGLPECDSIVWVYTPGISYEPFIAEYSPQDGFFDDNGEIEWVTHWISIEIPKVPK